MDTRRERKGSNFFGDSETTERITRAREKMVHTGIHMVQYFDTAVAPIRPTRHNMESISGILIDESDEK